MIEDILEFNIFFAILHVYYFIQHSIIPIMHSLKWLSARLTPLSVCWSSGL
jgi:hypothetical protein